MSARRWTFYGLLLSVSWVATGVSWVAFWHHTLPLMIGASAVAVAAGLVAIVSLRGES